MRLTKQQKQAHAIQNKIVLGIDSDKNLGLCEVCNAS